MHWRRLVKNIWVAKQSIGGQQVVKSDKCMGVSQLLGARARAAPKVYAYGYIREGDLAAVEGFDSFELPLWRQHSSLGKLYRGETVKI